jgi:nitrogen-specific signal transduction histidine kinase/CheY-like chemotaxis protein
LRQARERQDAILRSLPVVFTSRATVHPFGALFVSDSIAPMTGFEPNRFLEEPEIGLGRIHPDDIEGVVNCLMKASETGSYACEYRWMCSDGGYRRFLDQGVWVADGPDGGEIIGTLLDVTEKRDLEDQLSQARKLEAVGRLTGGVAHDFNNLLTVVLGNADILLRRSTDDRATRQLGAIRAAADRGQALTRQLLAFSRRQHLHPQPVDLNRLVRDFAPLIRQAVGEGVELDLDLSGRDVHVLLDPAHLENALLNLAVNARDAMKGRGRLTIATEVREGEDAACLSVTDTGEGMTPEVAERIFEPFYTTKEVGQGTGLGLSQVHGFVNQSGGRVTVTSRPGEGAAFDLSLPLSATAPEAPAPRHDAIEAPTGSERILVVEDDPAVLSTCVDMLAGLGYQVDVAIDGQGALNRLQAAGDYDLLFSDVVMPGGVSGIDLALQARRSQPTLKILLTSGYLGEEGLQTDHGFTVLDKPYQRDDLALCIRQALDRPEDRKRAVAIDDNPRNGMLEAG